MALLATSWPKLRFAMSEHVLIFLFVFLLLTTNTVIFIYVNKTYMKYHKLEVFTLKWIEIIVLLIQIFH